jgi:hypothetical protein
MDGYKKAKAPAPAPQPNPDTSASFPSWWKKVLSARQAMGQPLDPNPADPDYNYQALFQYLQQHKQGLGGFSSQGPPQDWNSPARGEGRGHFPDTGEGGATFKADSDPRAILHGVDTRTGKQVAPTSYTGPLTTAVRKDAPKYAGMKPNRSRAAGWQGP